ncbi:unnamed protein product [Danaus chrysippus]|uniref:(African queen) hypothetical protein n=1 Tax=Danaus chrysippus TaxID=151541 RepID=A0A8J2R885_9NEOP|nr:unnamed protein product [Danaus chrysippus]
MCLESEYRSDALIRLDCAYKGIRQHEAAIQESRLGNNTARCILAAISLSTGLCVCGALKIRANDRRGDALSRTRGSPPPPGLVQSPPSPPSHTSYSRAKRSAERWPARGFVGAFVAALRGRLCRHTDDTLLLVCYKYSANALPAASALTAPVFLIKRYQPRYSLGSILTIPRRTRREKDCGWRVHSRFCLIHPSLHIRTNRKITISLSQ